MVKMPENFVQDFRKAQSRKNLIGRGMLSMGVLVAGFTIARYLYYNMEDPDVADIAAFFTGELAGVIAGGIFFHT